MVDPQLLRLRRLASLSLVGKAKPNTGSDEASLPSSVETNDSLFESEDG